jgi:hypothetical protein
VFSGTFEALFSMCVQISADFKKENSTLDAHILSDSVTENGKAFSNKTANIFF